MRCVVFENDTLAMAAALDALSLFEPFAAVPLGVMIPLVKAQIKRKHYLITLNQNKVVGYVGWGECADSLASRWSRGGYRLTMEECLEGESLAISLFCASTSTVSRFQTAFLRKRFAGRKWYGIRDKDEAQRPMHGRF